MNITEAHEVVKLLRYLDGSEAGDGAAYTAALYLAARASQALQLAVTLDKEALATTLSEVER